MSDARRQPQAPAFAPAPATSSAGRTAGAPLPTAEATTNEAVQSHAAKEELLEVIAGGTQRAAPAAGGGRVRDPWSTFKAAKESTLAFDNFASQAFADLEGDMSVSFFHFAAYT